MHKHEAYAICSSYINQFVVIQTRDGRSHHGLIEKVDNDHVYILKPKNMDGYRGDKVYKETSNRSGDNSRLYGYPGYGYGYGYPGYGYGFSRVALPLSFLTGVALGSLFW